MSSTKAIVILVDGLSADYFAAHRARLPHLADMAGQGFGLDLAPFIAPPLRPGPEA